MSGLFRCRIGKIPDTKVLDDIPVPIGIISNWDKSLPQVLKRHFKTKFVPVIYSEKEKVQKPDMEIFKRALRDIDIKPANIFYVGDSVRLDMIPAQKMGLRAILIDRYNNFVGYEGMKIKSLEKLREIFTPNTF